MACIIYAIFLYLNFIVRENPNFQTTEGDGNSELMKFVPREQKSASNDWDFRNQSL